MAKPSLILCVIFGLASTYNWVGHGVVSPNKWQPVALGRHDDERGEFKQAAGVFAAALQRKDQPAEELATLAFELDRLERIKKDYPWTNEELFKELNKPVQDFTAAEFDK